MKKIASCLLVSVSILVAASAAFAQTPTSRIVSAANKFLSTLDEKQKQSVLFAYDDEEQRKRWSNLPISIVPRAGLSFKDMNATQRTAAMDLLSAALSRRGLEKVRQIMDADEVLKTSESNGPPPGRSPGGPPGGGPGGGRAGNGAGRGGRGGRGGGGLLFGADLYFFSILGTPSEKLPGCCSLEGTISLSTSPSLVRRAF